MSAHRPCATLSTTFLLLLFALVTVVSGEQEVFLTRQEASAFLSPNAESEDSLHGLLEYYMAMEVVGYWGFRCELEIATRHSFKPAYCA